MLNYPNLETKLPEAVEHFWLTRVGQSQKSSIDQGSRKAVTGGKQLDGFVEIIVETMKMAGLSESDIYANSTVQENLPGYYRPEKRWDIIAVSNKKLVAAVELKSMASSFGNNFNNRVEEVLGSATDLWTAYREGAIPLKPRPWLGYLMLLVNSEASIKPKKLYEPHFQVFEEFQNTSYATLFQILLSKLIKENLYTSTSLILTPAIPLRTKKSPSICD